MSFLLRFVILCAGIANNVLSDYKFSSNGILAERGQFPYQVSLYSPHFDAKGVCSGSIIGPRHILTTALCTPRTEEERLNFVVIVGCTDLQSTDCDKYKVEKAVFHPERNGKGKHEIAILILTADILLDENVQIISLSRDHISEVQVNILSRLGWVENKLHFKEVKTISDEECLTKLKVEEIPVEVFCTEGGYSNWVTFGGPVVFNDRQVGLVLLGNTGTADAHLRVENYIDFIENVLVNDEVDTVKTRHIDEL